MELIAPGATPQRIDNGLQLAAAVFSAAGVTPEQAARAAFAVEGWDMSGFAEDKAPSDTVMQAASTLADARQAALQACYACGPIPAGAALDVVPD